MMKKIKGAGGNAGAPASRTPIEYPDSLESRQYARLLDAISEGEVYGLLNGMKSIILNGVPLQNPDGSMNFQGVTVAERKGTQDQAYIPGFPAVETESAVATQVTFSAPVTRTITNSNVDAVRVTIGVPRLFWTAPTNGDTGGNYVTIKIEVQNDGGGYATVIEDDITGKAMSRYQRSYRVPLTGNGPWDVRVSRVSPDWVGSNGANDTWWDSYTEIIDAKLRYPNTSIVGIEVDSSQFSSVPSRGYEYGGILVKIPSNYDPDTREYDGIWDGTFQIGLTDNPAWIFYDLVTEERYGLGQFVDANLVDKWALYDIARYCDGMVDDGFGGEEPRFTCNVYIQSRQEAYNVLMYVASVFRGMLFWGSGAITAVADKPSDPVALYVPANVIDGVFNYSSSDRRQRHTAVAVTWNDNDNYGKQAIEYVQDDAAVAKYGLQETNLVAFGCTSRGQARRIGKWLLYTEQYETESVNFRVGFDAINIYPGAVFQTQDPNRAGVRFGGRIVSATSNEVTLDAPVTLDAGTYRLSVTLPDGTVESRAVINAAGVHSDLEVYPDFSATPIAHAVWVLSEDNLEPEVWRCISILEADKNTFEIEAVSHNPDKYSLIEEGIKFEAPPTSLIDTSIPPTPTQVVMEASSFRDASGQIAIKIDIGWVSSAFRSEISYRENLSNWVTVETFDNNFTILPALAGATYDIQIVAISTAGRRSGAAFDTLTIDGTVFRNPGSITSLTTEPMVFATKIKFTTAEELWQSDHVEIWESLDNNRANATMIAALRAPVSEFVREGLEIGVPRYYWARVVDPSETAGAWFPSSATGGVMGVATDDPEQLLDLLADSITIDQLGTSLRRPIIAYQGQINDNAASVIQEALDLFKYGERQTVAEFTLTQNSNSISALASSNLILFSRVDQNLAAIQQEAITRANADSAEAMARNALAVQVNYDIATNTALIEQEAIARANADSAEAQARELLGVSLGYDIAAVEVTANAALDATGEIEARWGVRVQAMDDGVRALAGLELLAGSDGESIVGVLADKFVVYNPTDTEESQPVFIVGDIAGTPSVGIDGNLVVDGSMTAKSLAAGTITAASGVIGNLAITTANIQDAAVQTLKIGTNAVTVTSSATFFVNGTTPGSWKTVLSFSTGGMAGDMFNTFFNLWAPYFSNIVAPPDYDAGYASLSGLFRITGTPLDGGAPSTINMTVMATTFKANYGGLTILYMISGAYEVSVPAGTWSVQCYLSSPDAIPSGVISALITKR